MSNDPQDDFAAIAKPLPTGKGAKAPAESDDFAGIAHPVEFTDNSNGEGTYEMSAPHGGKIKIPYSKVLDAGKAGYHITPDDFKRFTTDYGYADAKSKGTRARIDQALAPADESTWSGRGLNVLKGGTSGIVNPLIHPIQALQSLPSLGGPTPMTGNAQAQAAHAAGVKSQGESIREQVKDAKEHPVYSVSALLAPWLLSEGAGRFAPKIPGVKGLKEGVGEHVRGLVGDEPAQDVVNKTLKENENSVANADATNAANTEKHLGDTLDALHETTGKELEHSASEKARKETHDAKNEADRKEFNEKELARIQKEGQARVDALEKNKGEIEKYKEKLAQTKAENISDYRREIERQNVESKLNSASKALDEKFSAAKTKARNNYNATWNKWRDSVKDAKADMSPVVKSIKAQEASMNPQQVAQFRDIMRETSPDTGDMSEAERTRQSIIDGLGLNGTKYEELSAYNKEAVDKWMRNVNLGEISDTGVKAVPASRLHGWKSQLERAVRSTSDGTVRYAIGQVLDQLRTAEEDVSKSVGPQAMNQLAKARSITGPYFDAFVKSPTDFAKAAEQSLREQTPEYVKERNEQARLDRIAAYDPSIKSAANAVAELRESLSKIKPGKTAKDLTPLPAPPMGAVVRPSGVDVSLNSPSLPPRPAPAGEFQPKPFEPNPDPTRVAPPDKPIPVEPEITKAEIDDLVKAKQEAVRNGAKWLRYRGRWIATSAVVGSGMIFNFLHMNLAAAAYDVIAGGTAFYATGKIADFLEKPNVKNWLSHPTPRDIQVLKQLPPEQLGELSKAWAPITEAAEAKGIKVSPSLAKLFGATAAAQPRKKKATPQELLQQAQQNLQSGFQQSGFAR